ncbi:MAG: hypothetical protein ABI663_23905 [Chryseolinea sp.]
MDTLKRTFIALIAFFFISVLTACSGGGDDDPAPVSNELANLPEDTGGTHTPILQGTTSAQFGYYEYLPGGYATNTNEYPLLVFLHGQSERGKGDTKTILDKVLANGPPKLIKAGAWDPTYPMIVISPQFYQIAGDDNVNNWGGGKPIYLKNFIEYLIATYRVNESRIYLTGLSHGGNGVFDYLTGSVDDTQSHLAAAAPIAAYGSGGGFSKSKNTPIWTFVGENDATNFSTTKNFITKYNAQSPAPKYPAKITAFAGAGHDVWTRTYSSSGMDTADAAFSPFSMTLYDWMFQYKRE